MGKGETTVFESDGAGVPGRNRGIGTGEDEQLPERGVDNPNAGGGFLDFVREEEPDDLELPASESEQGGGGSV